MLKWLKKLWAKVTGPKVETNLPEDPPPPSQPPHPTPGLGPPPS